MLVARNCGMTPEQIDDTISALDQMRIHLNRAEDALAELRLSQLAQGTAFQDDLSGVTNALTVIADEMADQATRFMPVNQPVTATSANGTVTITLQPPITG